MGYIYEIVYWHPDEQKLISVWRGETMSRETELVFPKTCGSCLELSSRVRELEAERDRLKDDSEKFIMAVGLASTIVPTMVIDIEDPIGMMQKVCDEFDTLRARHAALEAENKRLREALKEIDNIQFDLPAKIYIYDKMKSIAQKALGGAE